MQFQVHRTAISRSKHSKPTEFLLSNLKLAPRSRVLDFGCGYGVDVRWLELSGYDVVGYDSYEQFGFSTMPTGDFDLVLMIYVVNIIPTETERKEALRKAWSFVKPGGSCYVVSRTRSQIASQARSGRWKTCSDGYISSESRRTFQKGHDRQDLVDLASCLDECQILNFSMKGRTDFSYLLIQRKQ